MRKTTPVRDYMSRLPEEIDHDDTVLVAVQLMDERNVRHVPVMKRGHLAGLLSRSDIQDAWLRFGESTHEKRVADVCTADLLKVSPVDPIPEVARLMADRGVTSALVEDAGVLVGIFTSSDALRVLADV